MAHSAIMQSPFCRLGNNLLFKIVQVNWASLPALFCTEAEVRTWLQNKLASLRTLALHNDEAAPELAETLARETNLERIVIGGQTFILESLRTTDCLDLLLSEAQATILSALLRQSQVLKRVRTSGRWLDVSCVQSLKAGAVVPLNLHRKSVWRMRTGAECCLLSGLARRRAHDFHSMDRSCPAMLETDALNSEALRGLSMLTRRSLTFAERRCDVKFVIGHLPIQTWRNQRQWPPWWLLMFLGLVVLMRQQEDARARQTGFGGATLAAHPFRMYTFQERIHMDTMLLTNVRSEVGQVEPRMSNDAPTSVSSSAKAVNVGDPAENVYQESVDVTHTMEL